MIEMLKVLKTLEMNGICVYVRGWISREQDLYSTNI